MKLIPSDPDVETIITRIRNGNIKLQPEFQRGEVWSTAKKQKLVDSILREWHVPPIHLMQIQESSKQEVLDGQQRLVSIRDFVDNQFEVNGLIEPISNQIIELHGMFFKDLPPEVQNRFNQFTLRVFRIVDYLPTEPGELFYRLNQQVNMTSAEQRNAFYGPVRDQVKELTKYMEQQGLNSEAIGFTNSRMAFDDVISRLLFAIEQNTLAEKITSPLLAERFRNTDPFSDFTVVSASNAIKKLGGAHKNLGVKVRYNKATLFSWLYYLSDVEDFAPAFASSFTIAAFVQAFEQARQSARTDAKALSHFVVNNELVEGSFLKGVLDVYNDRATSRVSDVSSVIARDVAIWFFTIAYCNINNLNIIDDYDKYLKIIRAFESYDAPKFYGDAIEFVDDCIELFQGGGR